MKGVTTVQERVLRVLEYEKMKEQLIVHASSSLGKEKVKSLLPTTQFSEVKRWQKETYEGTKVLRLRGDVPLGGIFNIRASVKRASIGGMLQATELLEIASTIYAARRIKNFLEDLIENDVKLPILHEYIEQLFPLAELEREIKQCIDDNGQVLDSASPTLRTIRAQIRSHEAGIRAKLENIIRSSSNQKKLSDAIITIRNDRYVVPVKQEYRGAFGGIIHDQSSSGATLFIEPESVVLLNNQLSEAKGREKIEIERILLELTEKVDAHSEELLVNVEVLAQLDFIFAKAHYSKQMKGTEPKLNDRGLIRLYKARHPFIPQNEVVPIDVELGDTFSSLIITGPNTGGKTVTLKTIGLLTLMTQSGLFIPAEEDSEMAVFQSIFADIGDEQSIEQNLSTFSSHMVNIIDILDKVSFESLVLFDELGAGTDPTEGAALAIAILDDVHKKGAKVVATTHYSELKGYAYNREGVMNASVEFDVETLKPTYRLLIGVPGRSNAFLISKRLGLSEKIIEQAKKQINRETNQIDKMIMSLEESKKASDKEWEEMLHLREEAERLHNELAEKLEQLEEQKDAILERAELEGNKLVEQAQKEADEIIKHLRKLQKEANVIKEHELIEAKKRLEDATPERKKKRKKQEKIKKLARPNFQVGDEVKVLSFGQKGHIVEKITDDEYQVQIGIMKMKVNASDLQLIDTPKEVETRPLATVRGSNHHVSPELDLRGERYEDALIKLEKYLDDAILAGYDRVSIIHGKGTMALRKGVKEFVKNHPQVKSSRDGGMNEGGLGNTVVEFK